MSLTDRSDTWEMAVLFASMDMMILEECYLFKQASCLDGRIFFMPLLLVACN